MFKATEWPIVKLLQLVKFHNKSHILATDYWYQSIRLAIFCLCIGIYLLGTIKANRENLPEDGILNKTDR
jgi:hypothetical protein